MFKADVCKDVVKKIVTIEKSYIKNHENILGLESSVM